MGRRGKQSIEEFALGSPTGGIRGDILAWFRAQEAKIGRHGFLDKNEADTGDEDALAALDEEGSA